MERKKSGNKSLEQQVTKAIYHLQQHGITLKNIKTKQTVVLANREFILPPHDEKEWYEAYFKESVTDRNMTVERATRESYGLLRYKQALAGSSDGSSLGAMFALSGHVLNAYAKEVYAEALREYDHAVAKVKS